MGIDVEIDGKTITLDVVALGDPMDSFLKGFYSKFFSEFEQPFNLFIKDCYQDLEANIYSYLDGKVGVPLGQDNLFTNLTIIWRNYQFKGRLGEAEDFWKHILNIILNWEGSRNSRIHKGSLYYFWSQTAISLGQLDKGFFLIHCATKRMYLRVRMIYLGHQHLKQYLLIFPTNRIFYIPWCAHGLTI